MSTAISTPGDGAGALERFEFVGAPGVRVCDFTRENGEDCGQTAIVEIETAPGPDGAAGEQVDGYSCARCLPEYVVWATEIVEPGSITVRKLPPARLAHQAHVSTPDVDGCADCADYRAGLLRRYTAFVRWDDDGDEEIDVDAAGADEARKLALIILARDYEPGGRIERVLERFGLYA